MALNDLLTSARARARERHDERALEEMEPGVMRVEAEVAAWHACAVQGGFSTPQIEAKRLSADRGGVAPQDEPQDPYEEVGEMCPDGTVGGDGAGESQSRRWKRLRPDGNWDLVTVYGYAVDTEERNLPPVDGRKWIAEVCTETMVCTDPQEPGSTEVTCDYDYDDAVTAFAYETEERALEVALNRVRSITAP